MEPSWGSHPVTLPRTLRSSHRSSLWGRLLVAGVCPPLESPQWGIPPGGARRTCGVHPEDVRRLSPVGERHGTVPCLSPTARVLGLGALGTYRPIHLIKSPGVAARGGKMAPGRLVGKRNKARKQEKTYLSKNQKLLIPGQNYSPYPELPMHSHAP